jgi:hypothetical protein
MGIDRILSGMETNYIFRQASNFKYWDCISAIPKIAAFISISKIFINNSNYVYIADFYTWDIKTIS